MFSSCFRNEEKRVRFVETQSLWVDCNRVEIPEEKATSNDFQWALINPHTAPAWGETISLQVRATVNQVSDISSQNGILDWVSKQCFLSENWQIAGTQLMTNTCLKVWERLVSEPVCFKVFLRIKLLCSINWMNKQALRNAHSMDADAPRRHSNISSRNNWRARGTSLALQPRKWKWTSFTIVHHCTIPYPAQWTNWICQWNFLQWALGEDIETQYLVLYWNRILWSLASWWF